jgi:hypothetical protein
MRQRYQIMDLDEVRRQDNNFIGDNDDKCQSWVAGWDKGRLAAAAVE